MKYDKIILLNFSIFLMCITLFTGCTQEKAKLAGLLLVSMSIDVNKNLGIYSIDLENNEELREYFVDNSYTDVCFPIKMDKTLYCIAKNIKGNYFTILKVSEGKVIEIFKLKERILSYALAPNKIVFIQKIDDKSYLFSYEFENKSIVKAYDGEVDEESRPIICPDGSIVFVAIENNTFNIKRKNGNKIEQIINGRYPLLINSGNELIYYISRSIKRYNISKKSDVTILKKVTLMESPILSPDQNYLAFIEYDYVGGIGIEKTDYLSVFSLTNRKKSHIRAYFKARLSLRVSGINWVDSNN